MAKAVGIIKKRWIPILAPQLFNNTEIGETYLADAATVVGRAVTCSMMTLTNDPQKQAINLQFSITGIQADKAQTTFNGYTILPGALRRFVRRARDKFEDSFVVKTKDDVLVRLKPFVVTRTRATGGTLALLRKATRTYLAQESAKNTFDQLTELLLTHKIQSDAQALIRRVFPVSTFEIKTMERAPKTAKPIKIDPNAAALALPTVKKNEPLDDQAIEQMEQNASETEQAEPEPSETAQESDEAQTEA